MRRKKKWKGVRVGEEEREEEEEEGEEQRNGEELEEEGPQQEEEEDREARSSWAHSVCRGPFMPAFSRA